MSTEGAIFFKNVEAYNRKLIPKVMLGDQNTLALCANLVRKFISFSE